MIVVQLAAAAAMASLPVKQGIAGAAASALAAALLGSVRDRKQSADKKAKDGEETEAVNGKETESVNSSQISLEWARLDCTIDEKKPKGKQSPPAKKEVLRGAVGRALPGRVVAIMGPSGGGKSTLLSAIAGQLPENKKMTLTGHVYANGVPLDPQVHHIGFVPQEDIFFSNLTVMETLEMAAALQLPRQMTPDQRTGRVQEVLKMLSLTQCAHTMVGGAKVRGISGGEKKRLSIGLELLSEPSVILLDEPTTGLDAFQAEKVMKVLQVLAREKGKTIICSIHQPRSSIFQLLDDLVLLAEGSTVYSGPCKSVLTFFGQALGSNCPAGVNPAEFLLDNISIDLENEATSRKRVSNLVTSFSKDAEQLAGQIMQHGQSNRPDSGKSRGDARRMTRCGILTQIRLLFGRSFRQVARDKATNMIRAVTNVNSALVFGSIYWRLKKSQSTIQDRMGLLQVAAINTAMASVTKTLTAFTRERLVVNRERTKAMYGIGPYLAAKLVAELPISACFPLMFGSVVYPMCGLHKDLKRFAQFLGIVTLESFTSSSIGLTVGAMVPSAEAANALGPAVMVIFIVFGGYYCNEENVPAPLRWIPKVSLIRHGFEALCVNEFKGLEFETSGKPSDISAGDEVLESRLGFGDSNVSKSALGLTRIMLFNYYASYLVLKRNKQKFCKLRET